MDTPIESLPVWAETLAANQATMSSTLADILSRIDTVTGEIKPLVDSLAKSPMLKMLGVKL